MMNLHSLSESVSELLEYGRTSHSYILLSNINILADNYLTRIKIELSKRKEYMNISLIRKCRKPPTY